MTNLYLVAHSNNEGNNFDLFVHADNAVEAISFWTAYFESDAAAIQAAGPVKVYMIPKHGPKGAITWHDPDWGVIESCIAATTAPVLAAPVFSEAAWALSKRD